MVQYCFFLCFGFLAARHVGSYLHDQGLNPHPPALEGKVSTTGPPGKSQTIVLFFFVFYLSFYTASSYWSSILYMLVYTCQFQSPNSSHHHHPPPPRFPPLVSIRLFSTSVSLFLPCKPVHLYHFSRFHIYALTYDICFSLSDLLHSV